MPSFEDLEYFLSVSKTLNVSRAAELCGVSQPAISHSLKRLEAELGVELLHREKRGVRLSRVGDQFVRKAQDLMAQWKSLSASIASTSESVAGRFRLGCHPSVAIYSLPLFLKRLQAHHPELDVSLVHGLSREITHEVIEWRIDFGIVINPVEHPDLVIRELGVDEVTLWMRPEKNPPMTLIYEPGLLQSQNLLKQLEKKKIRFSRFIESSSLEVISALTSGGCGVGILPTRVAARDRSQGLKRFSEAPTFKDRLCLIYRVGAQNHASGKAVISAIVRAGI